MSMEYTPRYFISLVSFFDIHKVNTELPNSWKNERSCKSGNINPNNLLDTLYAIPGVVRKALRDF